MYVPDIKINSLGIHILFAQSQSKHRMYSLEYKIRSWIVVSNKHKYMYQYCAKVLLHNFQEYQIVVAFQEINAVESWKPIIYMNWYVEFCWCYLQS